MRRSSFCFILALALLGGSGIGTGHADAPRPMRVLFVGNSYTRFNDLPRMVRRVSESVPDARPIRASRVTHPGFSLRRHWRHERLRRRIARESYEAIVLQGRSTSPLEAPDELREYANRFAAHAETHGARVVLFETWPRREGHFLYRRSELVDDPAQMLERIEDVYVPLGQELDAPVAPVGRAWLTARRELPSTSLHRRDGTHPTIAGTYLAACVLYGTLSGRDPREIEYRHWRVGRRTAARMRELAAEVIAAPATLAAE